MRKSEARSAEELYWRGLKGHYGKACYVAFGKAVETHDEHRKQVGVRARAVPAVACHIRGDVRRGADEPHRRRDLRLLLGTPTVMPIAVLLGD